MAPDTNDGRHLVHAIAVSLDDLGRFPPSPNAPPGTRLVKEARRQLPIIRCSDTKLLKSPLNSEHAGVAYSLLHVVRRFVPGALQAWTCT